MLKNTNEEHAVSIKGEVDASTINAEIDKTKGEIKIKLETQPTYSNVEDGNGFTSGLAQEYSILGIGSHGSKQMQAPSSTGCQEHHNFISVDGSSIKICSECSAYQYTKTSTTLNAKNAEETQEKTYIYENNDGKYVKINNTQGHEHHFSQEWAWVIDPEDSTKYTSASLTLQCTPESNDNPDDCDFSVTLPAEIADNGVTPHCTHEVTKTFTATANYNGITYEGTKEVTLQPVDHKWSSEVSNPTCTENGKTTSTCLICGETSEEPIEKLGHDYQLSETVAPKCEKDGKKIYICSRCGETYEESINALGHSWGEWVTVTEATCTESGLEKRVCGNDGNHTETRSIPAMGHADTDGDGLCNACGASMLAVNLPYTNEFLYKVGNQGAVSQSLLFKNIPASFDPVITTTAGAATGSYKNGSFKFENTGVVQITCGDVVLDLEVVDAVNAVSLKDITGAILSINDKETTQNNIVLLKDISGLSGANSVVINNGYALYGNGFKMTCTGNGGRNGSTGLGEGYIQVADGGQLDNVIIIAPDFPKAYLYSGYNLYDYYVTEGENKIDDNHYAYQLSAVRTSGVAAITNSYIYGARNNILAEGTLSLDNCVLTNGSLSNLHFSSANGVLNLKDLTTVQYKRTANDLKGNEKTILGLGIIIGPRPDANVDISSNPTINISGYFKQYNWVCKQDGNDVTSSKIASRFVSAALSNPEFVTKVNGIDYTDLGVIYLNGANRTINDSRVNHGGYVGKTISISGISGYAYAPAANSQEVEILDSQYIYKPSKQKDSLPFLKYSDVSDDDGKTFTRNAAFDYTFTVKLDGIGSYMFDFEKLSAILMGEKAEYTVKDSSNNIVNDSVQINSAGTNRFNIVINSNKSFDKNGNKSEGKERTYTFSLALVGNLTELPKPTKKSEPSGTPLKSTKSDSVSSDWTMAVAPLDGLKISYWSTNEKKEKLIDFSNVTVKKTTSNSITIDGPDYTLLLNSTTIKGSANVWVPADDGKLYVTASTANYVTSSTSTRETTITYSFKDGGDNLLTFSKKFNVGKPVNGDTLYNHSELVNNGKITTSFSSCLLPGTLITMADGTYKEAKNIAAGDLLKVFNHETGKYDTSVVLFNDSEEKQMQTVINLMFDNGKQVGVISEHGFFDLDLNKYVYIHEDNYQNFIGHKFFGEGGAFRLDGVYLTEESVEVYSPVTAGTLNYFTEDMLSMPGGIEGLFNYFAYNSNLKFDEESMAKDINQYGLLDYSYFEEDIPYDVYLAFNGKYLGVSMAKGLLSENNLHYYIERYSQYWEQIN